MYIKYVPIKNNILETLSNGVEFLSSHHDQIDHITVSNKMYHGLYEKYPEMCLKTPIRADANLNGSLVGFHYKINSTPNKEEINVIYYDPTVYDLWIGGVYYPQPKFVTKPQTNIFKNLYRKYFG